MVLRQLDTTTSEEKVHNIEESLVKGKDAVSLDTTDGMSWSVLGNINISLTGMQSLF